MFDEVETYSAHLAEEHDLHDDDGAESSFGTLLVAAPAVPAAAAMRGDLIEGPRPRPAGPGDRGRPWGLVALVLLLVFVLGGLVAFGPRPGGDDDEVAELSADDTTTTEEDGESPTTAPPTTAAGGGPTTTAAPSGGGAPPPPSSAPPTTASASGGGGGPAPRPTTTTTIPTTTTTRPPTATFVAPTTSGARIDGCQRVKNQWRITYSWRFDGGTGWRPAGYTATGGGRYQHVVNVPRAGTTLIATVQVLDPANSSHDVALRPVLSSDSC